MSNDLTKTKQVQNSELGSRSKGKRKRFLFGSLAILASGKVTQEEIDLQSKAIWQKARGCYILVATHRGNSKPR